MHKLYHLCRLFVRRIKVLKFLSSIEACRSISNISRWKGLSRGRNPRPFYGMNHIYYFPWGTDTCTIYNAIYSVNFFVLFRSDSLPSANTINHIKFSGRPYSGGGKMAMGWLYEVRTFHCIVALLMGIFPRGMEEKHSMAGAIKSVIRLN